MGYTDIYSGTTKVDLGNGFHVEVKNHLTSAEHDKAMKTLLKNQAMDSDGNVTAAVDMIEYQVAIVNAAVKSWNITDESDNVLPVTPENVGLLTQEDRDKVYAAVESNSKERSPQEQATFRGKN